jgi:hypothetical protein
MPVAANTKRNASRNHGKMSEFAFTAATTSGLYSNVAGSGAGAPGGGFGTGVSCVSV